MLSRKDVLNSVTKNIVTGLNLKQLPDSIYPDRPVTVTSPSGNQIICKFNNQMISFADASQSEIAAKYKLWAKNNSGRVNFSIYTDNHPDMDGLGSEFFLSALYFLSKYSGNIVGIIGQWQDGTNFDQFQAGLQAGMSVENAALGTWTGYNAQRVGYKRVKPLTSDNTLNASRYEFLFTKR